MKKQERSATVAKHFFEYSDVLKFKEECAKHFPDHVHFHDGCGGQYFSLEEKNDSLRDFICKYFEEQGFIVEFADDEQIFTVQGNDTRA